MAGEGTLMVCGSDESVRLWSVENGTPTALLLGDTGLHLTCVDGPTIDNQWLAQGTTTRGVQLVDIYHHSTATTTVERLTFSTELN